MLLYAKWLTLLNLFVKICVVFRSKVKVALAVDRAMDAKRIYPRGGHPVIFHYGVMNMDRQDISQKQNLLYQPVYVIAFSADRI